MARKYVEQCARIMTKPMLFMGFEEWDLFIIIAVAYALFALKLNFGLILLIVGVLGCVLKYGKRGKPAKTLEHYVQWFFNPKIYTALPQAMIESIPGREYPKLNSLQESLPYHAIEGGVVHFKDNSLAVAYELMCPGIEHCCKDQLVVLSGRIESFLTNLEGGRFSYQVHFTMDSDYKSVIEGHAKADISNPLMAKIHRQRVESLEAQMKGQALRRRRCVLFINDKGKEASAVKGLHLFQPRQTKHNLIQDTKTQLKEFLGALKPIEEGLQDAGFSCHRMDTEQVGKLIYKFLNPDRIASGIPMPGLNEKEDIIQQLCCSDLKVDHDSGEYLQFGGYFHKFVTLKSPPESIYPAMLSHITDMDFCEFDVIVNLDIPSLEWSKNKLERYRKWAYGNLSGFFGIVNKDAEMKIKQVEELIEELEISDQKLIRMQMTIHIYGTDIDIVKERTAKVLSRMSDLNGAEGHNERWGAVMPVFLSVLPGWTRESSRQMLIKTRHVSDLLPLFSQFDTHDEPTCIFQNRTSGLVTFDPFSSDLDAYNMVVIGAAGAGKSFTVQQIINQFSKDKIEIFIDLGSSYQRLVHLKGGTYIPLGLKQKFTLNLFDLPEGRGFQELDEEGRQEILSLKTNTIGLMIGGFSQFKFGQIIEDYIAQSIRHMYEVQEKPILSDLKSSLKELAKTHKVWKENHDVIEGLLGIWCKDGQFGAFTDGQSTISLDNNVICFELKGLSSFKKLQAVMFSVITNVIWSKVMGRPELEKIVVCDEAWGILSTPEGASFISECYRTSRKYKFSVISISQSLEEFRANKLLSAAILGNAHTTMILRQNNADAIKNLVEFFDFNEQERALIESLKIKKGIFSEVFLSQKKGMKTVRGIMRICPTPLELWMATTNRDDMNHFESVQKSNPSWETFQVLEQCAHDYPSGKTR